MLTFDDNPNILKWASEEIAIPYVSPVDRQRHKYFPDFIIELKNRLGKIETAHDRDWETYGMAISSDAHLRMFGL